MNKLLPLLCLWLTPVVAFAGGMITGVSMPVGKKMDFFPTKLIRMEVGFDYEFAEATIEVNDLKSNFADIGFYCRWTNTSKKEAKLLLKDHDNFHGTLDYPWGLEVRISGGDGKVISANFTPEGWWSSSNIMSQLSNVDPGDMIVLKPNESVVRWVPLESVLGGLDINTANRELIKAKGYTIEVRLGGILPTNRLKVRPKKPATP